MDSMSTPLPDVTGFAPELGAIADDSPLNRTCGKFRSEPESCRTFDKIVKDTGLWRSVSEVDGYYVNRRPWQDEKGCRIDRILFPTTELIEKYGWKLGPVGVECKTSEYPVGPLLSQCLDYTHAVWESKANGMLLMLRWIFIWPLDGQKGAIESVMAQNCVGAAWMDNKGRLRLKSGGTHAFGYNGDIPVVKPLLSGRKTGSR